MAPIDTDRLSGDPLLRRVWEQMGRPAGCRVVGGWIRDRLIGRPVGDLDLTIEGDEHSSAELAQQLAAALGTRAHLLGSAPHRVWRIDTPGLKVELWPVGALTHSEDMARRDFACNALSWELPDGPLEDLVGGLPDLEAGRLRAISRANLEDDPVRLLRGPRFLAQLEAFDLEDRTRSWIGELAPTLAGAPRERIGQELTALLRGPAASRGLRECVDLGLFEPAGPAGAALDPGWLHTNLTALDLLCGAGVSPASHRSGVTADAARLAFLYRSWGIPTGGRLAPYSWPKSDRETALRAARLLDEALTTVESSPADRRELAWHAGAAFPALFSLARALAPHHHHGWRRWWRQWQRNFEKFLEPTPLLTGSEISRIAGVEPGPELGRIAQSLLRAQVRGTIRTVGGATSWITRSG